MVTQPQHTLGSVAGLRRMIARDIHIYRNIYGGYFPINGRARFHLWPEIAEFRSSGSEFLSSGSSILDKIVQNLFFPNFFLGGFNMVQVC